MYCIVGLGNPGHHYRGTRHNIGFEVVDRISFSLDSLWEPGRGEYYFAKCSFKDQSFILVKPTTFMNRSGLAVLSVLEHFECSREHLLVVLDDLQLPLGRLRLRISGSDGGHNGLGSIIYELQSEQFLRLRCGIGSDALTGENIDTAEFVLSSFGTDEHPRVQTMLEQAEEACLSTIAEGFQNTMTVINRKPDQSEN
ncbi:MAG: aminoacyl-tRNA hydrolase [bacterium]